MRRSPAAVTNDFWSPQFQTELWSVSYGSLWFKLCLSCFLRCYQMSQFEFPDSQEVPSSAAPKRRKFSEPKDRYWPRKQLQTSIYSCLRVNVFKVSVLTYHSWWHENSIFRCFKVWYLTLILIFFFKLFIWMNWKCSQCSYSIILYTVSTKPFLFNQNIV